jgi:hypothetical protein
MIWVVAIESRRRTPRLVSVAMPLKMIPRRKMILDNFFFILQSECFNVIYWGFFSKEHKGKGARQGAVYGVVTASPEGVYNGGR